MWKSTDEAIRAKLEAENIIDGILGCASEHEKKNYSIRRAIMALVDGDRVEAGLEREISSAIGERLGKTTSGMFVPTRWSSSFQASLDTKSGGSGGFMTSTRVFDLIELLRNKTQVIALGATVLTGLRENLAFPVKLAASNGNWVSQNPGADVTDSDANFGQKTMSPKTYQASTSYSRQFLSQSAIDVENLVRTDIATAHALAIDLAAINGTGLQNQPLGLLGTTGIGSVTIGTNGGVPTNDTIVDLETAVADANGDEAGMKYLTTPSIRGKLRKTQQFPGTNGIPVWESIPDGKGSGSLAGYLATVSKQVPSNLVKGTSNNCHAIIFGSWPSMLIGEWGFMELVVDPYAKKKQGIVEVTSFQMVDILVRQPAQFAVCQDATLS